MEYSEEIDAYAKPISSRTIEETQAEQENNLRDEIKELFDWLESRT